jgi:hypothetical protein
VEIALEFTGEPGLLEDSARAGLFPEIERRQIPR